MTTMKALAILVLAALVQTVSTSAHAQKSPFHIYQCQTMYVLGGVVTTCR